MGLPLDAGTAFEPHVVHTKSLCGRDLHPLLSTQSGINLQLGNGISCPRILLLQGRGEVVWARAGDDDSPGRAAYPITTLFGLAPLFAPA